MSMGYDPDDPRGARVRARMDAGIWQLKPGQRANVDASKFRAGALPGRPIRRSE